MNKYDLTITNCVITVDNIYDWNTNEDTNSRELKRRIFGGLLVGMFSDTAPLYSTAYLNPLHKLQTNRILESGNKPILYSKNYLIELDLYTEEELSTVDSEPNDTDKNVLLKKHKRSYLLNNIIVQFEDDYEITIENNEHLYYKFLILMLCDYGIMYIDEILDYHLKKVPDKAYFISKLKKHLMIIPEILKDKDILEVIYDWIDNVTVSKVVKTPFPVIALFCNLLNKSKVDVRLETETIENYCIKNCKNYGLDYSDRVRQNYSDKPTKGNIDKLKKLILPLTDEDISIKILEYLKTIK